MLTSPDGHFTATVREVNIDGSVMVSQPYQVLVESGLHGERRTGVALLVDKTDPPVVRWAAPSTLAICYYSAHILQFQNHFYSTSQDVSKLREAEVVLTKHEESNPC